MGAQFYPLAGHIRFGILKLADRKPVPARFLTPEEAKALAFEQRIGAAR
jgi:ParB-like chromosome segregation protein Spo0J